MCAIIHIRKFPLSVSELRNSSGQKQKSGSKYLLKILICAFNQLRTRSLFLHKTVYCVAEMRALPRLGCFQICNSVMLPKHHKRLSRTSSHRTLIPAITSVLNSEHWISFSLACIFSALLPFLAQTSTQQVHPKTRSHHFLT